MSRVPTYEMFTPERLQELCGYAGVEFDPESSEVSKPRYGQYSNIAVSSPDQAKLVEFRIGSYDRPPIDYESDICDLRSGIVEVEEQHAFGYDRFFVGITSEASRDESLHGLLEENRGYIAIYPGSLMYNCALYRFMTLVGPTGVNQVYKMLGRVPGIDIPEIRVEPIANPQKSGSHTAGQIVESIAGSSGSGIWLPTHGIANFDLTHHDLASGSSSHSLSWIHSPKEFFAHFSHKAQDILDCYGDQIHDFDNRPAEVIQLALQLDRQESRLHAILADLATLELRLRDGGYSMVRDREVIGTHLVHAFNFSSDLQAEKRQGGRFGKQRKAARFMSDSLMITSPDTSVAIKQKTGYWTAMQMISGALATRLALHEVHPHPEATDAQTSRTLSVLSALKNEIDRRIRDNSEFTLQV